MEAQKEFDRRLLTQFAPATAFINEDLEIIHTRGNISRYLKLGTGRASLNILKMTREGILLGLRTAIAKAGKENTTVHKQLSTSEMKMVNRRVSKESARSISKLSLSISATSKNNIS